MDFQILSLLSKLGLDPTINYEDVLQALKFCPDLQPYIDKIRWKLTTHSNDRKELLIRLIMLILMEKWNNIQPDLENTTENTSPTLETENIHFELETTLAHLNTYLQTEVNEPIVQINIPDNTTNNLPLINDLYKLLHYVEYLQKSSRHYKQKRHDFNNNTNCYLDSLNSLRREDEEVKKKINQYENTILRLQEEESLECGQWDNHRSELESHIKEGVNRMDALGKEMDGLLNTIIQKSQDLVNGESEHQKKIKELRRILEKNEREIADLKKADWLVQMKIQSSRYVDSVTHLYRQYVNNHYDIYFEHMEEVTKWAQVNLKRQHKIYTTRVTQMLQQTASQVLITDSMYSSSTISNGTQSGLSTSIAEATSLASHWEDIHLKMNLYKMDVDNEPMIQDTTNPKVLLQQLLQLLLKANEEFCKLYAVHEEDPSSGELVARDLFQILSQIKLHLATWSSNYENIQISFWCNQIHKARLNLMENFQLYGGDLSELLSHSFSDQEHQNIYQLQEHNMKVLFDLLDDNKDVGHDDPFDLASRSTSGDSFFNVQVD